MGSSAIGGVFMFLLAAFLIYLGIISLPEFGEDTTTTVHGCVKEVQLVKRGSTAGSWRSLQVSLGGYPHRFIMRMNRYWHDDHPVWSLQSGNCIELQVPTAHLQRKERTGFYDDDEVEIITLRRRGEIVNDDSWLRWFEPIFAMGFATLWVAVGSFAVADGIWGQRMHRSLAGRALKYAVLTYLATFLFVCAVMLVVFFLGIPL